MRLVPRHEPEDAGGGALGSYQAGAFQALCRSGFEPEWIAGISIGAINAAIIAGNGPETRVDRLKELEDELGIDGILFELNFGAAIPAEVMMRSLQLICEQVMPRFK